ncbi:MAG: membrane protein insertase YidC [Gemmobacter sp.]|nr:membrane protein insertase YidC [Gemmobacter sp.]MBL8561129.1 membrane protein insertase YidC [Gemmobacter sp.]
MDDQNKNLILATVLSFLVILGWFWFFPPPEPLPETPVATEQAATPAAPQPAAGTEAIAAVPQAARLKVDTPRLEGSISLKGARFDDLKLKGYKVSLDANAETVRLLSPVGEPHAYYALHGWTADASLALEDTPGAATEWTLVEGDTLAPGKPVKLQWQNGKGLTFTRSIAIDDDYMFTVTDAVQNAGTAPVTLQPYGVVARHGKPTDLQNFYVLHEGVVGRTDGTLAEVDYDDVVELPQLASEGAQAEVTEATTDGWLGFTDKYWMTVLVPQQGKPFTAVVKYDARADIYQTETRLPAVTLAPGATTKVSSQLFAGAKEWETIRNYQKAGVAGFIDSIDWGWFFFFTKPIFWLLHHLHSLIGNMGLAIIALTFVLKLLVLPLAYKSYVSMARMKELQPEMEALKERAGDDKAKLQKEMMQLYKEKKINPAAGCLPIFLQIPIFFSLYKVIFVTLELRHAPFYGWLNDLSAPDPSSLFNLFGLLPWAAPEHGTLMATIFIGILPILLGISMWLQQKLNPAPTDPAQAMVFAWMPWVFMFMLGSFASGLVLYWITNNTITFMQQYAIMRSHGHKPDLFGNIKAGFKKKPAPVAPPAKGKK